MVLLDGEPMVPHTPRATIDFETRSACSLRAAGSWRYSLDPTTEVLCAAFRLPYWVPGRTALWHPAFPHLGIPEARCPELTELFCWIRAGKLVEAHNAWFERGVWTNKMVPDGWSPIQHEQWRCSAAKAAAHALPRKLDGAGDAMDLDVVKDTEGHKLMMKMCKPRKPVKADWLAWYRQHAPCTVCVGVGKIQEHKKNGEPKAKLSKCKVCHGTGHARDLSAIPPMPTLWHETREQLESLFQYCRQDVLAEAALSESLHDLNELETEIYLLDQKVNERGFQLDMRAVHTGLALIDVESVDLNRELRELTDGQVERATQRERMIDWLEENGLALQNTQKETLDEILADKHGIYKGLDPKLRRGVELMKLLGRSSTSKYVAMKSQACPDGRVRGGLLYHGAATGRWSGAGVQPHNFVKGSVQDMVTMWDTLKDMDRDTIIALPRDKKGTPYGNVMDVLAEAMRGTIVASPGHELFVADYSSIEACVLQWLAGDQEAMQFFRDGLDIYCVMAESIYGYPCNKNDHPQERAIGKVAVLGLGYQMGWKKFKETVFDWTGIVISDELAMKTVEAYREKFWRVKNLWRDMERAAINAVNEPGRKFRCGKVIWFVEGTFLYCELPSGRRLGYPDPEIHPYMMPWGEEKDCLTFMSINMYSRRWERSKTYGGMLVENVDQAVSRDLMAEGMLRCERSGLYVPVLSIHDEIVAECPIGKGDVHEFEQMMATVPAWGTDCPVKAEGWSGARYRK